jgi:hypothetical protein
MSAQRYYYRIPKREGRGYSYNEDRITTGQARAIARVHRICVHLIHPDVVAKYGIGALGDSGLEPSATVCRGMPISWL